MRLRQRLQKTGHFTKEVIRRERLMPSNWKSSIEGLRDNINHTFERYLSELKRKAQDGDEFWSPPVLELFGNGFMLDENDDEIIARLARSGPSVPGLQVESQNRLVVRGGKEKARKNKNRHFAS